MTQFGEFVTLTIDDNNIATIRMNRPPRNKMNAEHIDGLGKAVWEVAHNPNVRALIFTGGDEYFSAGGDNYEMRDKSFVDMVHTGSSLQVVNKAITEMPFPTIAAIEGFAVGGGFELALSADFRIMSKTARLQLAEILIGIMPGAGGTQRLPRLIAFDKAKEIIYTGRSVMADEALELGIVTKLADEGKTYEAALEMAQQFAKGAPLALRAAKRAVDHGINMSLDDALAFESQLFASLYATKDQKIGADALIETGRLDQAKFEGQ